MNKPKLLIIDDSPIDNSYLEMLIEVESIAVKYDIQSNAIMGLDYLSECPDINFPDVILVDINMPLMNGFEFVREFETEFYDKFPESRIFIMSSTKRLSEIEEAKKSPTVVDFIEKPLKKAHFDYILNNISKKV